MAGKFISIEDAARLLGVSIDEVNRLVDHRKLFPMRDGAALKFKVEEVERLAATLGDESGSADNEDALTLDLELPTPAADDLALGDAIDIGDLGIGTAADAGSQTIIRGGAGTADPASGLSGLALGDADDSSGDSADLVLESNIGASSPSLARPALDSGSLGGSLAGDAAGTNGGTLALGSGSLKGSQPGGALGGLSGSAAGSGFAAPVDGGLSLEDDGIAMPSLDLDAGLQVGSGPSAAGGSLAGGSLAGGSLAGGSLAGGSLAGDAFAGDAFELGGDLGDEENASVVIATEESGDSSFFTNVADDAASVSFDDSSVALESSSGSIVNAEAYLAPMEMSFSGWQIAGLTCCALFLLAGVFVMYEVAWTIRTPQGQPASAPLFEALGTLLGWGK